MRIDRETLDGLAWVEPATPSSQVRRAAGLSSDAASQLGFPNVGLEWLDDQGDAKPVLLVEFQGKDGRPGTVYAYAGVADGTEEALVEAGSAGRFMNLNVKGKYPYARLDVVAEGAG